MDLIGGELAGGNDLLDLSNADLAGGGGGGVEVAGGLVEDEVAASVGLVRLDEGVVTGNGGLEDVLAALGEMRKRLGRERKREKSAR